MKPHFTRGHLTYFITFLISTKLVTASTEKLNQLRGGNMLSNDKRNTQSNTVTYAGEAPRSSPLLNPERGMYWQDSYYASNPYPLDGASLAEKRLSSGMTIMLRLYYLDIFLNGDISESVLNDIEADFEAMREGGVKCILRFAYSNSGDSAVQEPDKAQLLSHINQLAPILQNAGDVIMLVQGGFIGPWGEWHSSTHFDSDPDGRKEIFKALLAATPSDRIVQIRTPAHKREVFQLFEYPEPTENQVLNGGFEGTDIESSWTIYRNGYTVSTVEKHDGLKSIAIANGGARQHVNLATPAGARETIILSGYSKAVGTSTGLSSDYSIYADLWYTDNTYQWGVTAKFTGGNHDWEYQEARFIVPEGKFVWRISLYAMYRDDIDMPDGIAYFDDISVLVIGPPIQTGGQVLTDEMAYSGSDLARTGHHNDCFLASDTDYGTYKNVTTDYPYLEQDTSYTAMGGETCALNPPRSECPVAQQELEMFHWTYLNKGYNQDVLATWSTCLDDIKSRLGYRLVLKSGIFPDSVMVGNTLPFDIVLENVGYASPVNKRRVQVVLRNVIDRKMCAATLENVDARKWYSSSDDGVSTHLLSGIGRLPAESTMTPGFYELLLHITDEDEVLRRNLDFKTKVANDPFGVGGDLNEKETGLVRLLHTINVVSTSTGGTVDPFEEGETDFICTVEDDILPLVPADPDEYLINGGFEGGSVPDDWSSYGTSGYAVSNAEYQSGSQSIAVTDGGARQYVFLTAPEGSIITISGYSKAVGVAPGLNAIYYSLYADMKYSDGSSEWGVTAGFPGGTSSDWDYGEVEFEVPTGMTVEQISLYAMYRDQASGMAYFDDITLTVV